MKPIKHPRPQLRRQTWESLDGSWQFLYDDDNRGRKDSWEVSAPWERDIEVPYTYETEKSGIGDKEFHPVVWYRKEFSIDKKQAEKRIRLHFEGVDYHGEVWVNGRYAGSHRGCYTRFSLDITDLVNWNGNNCLVLRVEDSIDMEQPRGKQRWMKDSFSCWYVQNTGIWKSVWFEYTGDVYLENIKITPDVDRREVTMEYELSSYYDGLTVEVEILFDGRRINTCRFSPTRKFYSHRMSVEDETTPFKIHLWYPRGFSSFDAVGPELYDLKVTVYRDSEAIDYCLSYFGMRKISIEKGQVLINNMPFYQKLILDQGYWPESSITPPGEEDLIRDLEIIIEAGYNGVRKHQKTEDERFLYHCDVEGILVWGEIGACYRFNDKAIEEFSSQWTKVIRQYYNHPSIVTWVPFNESWGIADVAVREEQQNFVNGIYYLTKGLDPMRPVVTNDGWEHTISDIVTIHDYEELGDALHNRFAVKEEFLNGINAATGLKRIFAHGYEYQGQPILISEFGGIAFDSEKGWGYGNMVHTEEEFLERFRNICRAIQNVPYLCGYCYTQVSDVEQEINGIVKADRSEKIPLEKLCEINSFS